ncbi:MAG: hypothetical protein H7X99_09705 [Saprospiraceae bacterium]|nr:hypothetical protein [Saprospiraceae bacterium]
MRLLIKQVILLAFLGIIVASCSKDSNEALPDGTPDYIEFGSYHGFCGGEKCIEIFRLDDVSVYEDTTDLYPSGTLNDERKFILLSSEKFEKVNSLIADFPSALLDETKVTFGIPDAYDQGGYYVGYKKENVLRVWLFDKNLNEVPSYTHSFLTEVAAKVELLKD